MAAMAAQQRNQEATCHVSNLDARVGEDLLWELFVQCGPVSSVFMPKDKVTGSHYGYGFVEFKQASDAAYAHKIMNMVKLFSAPMRVSRSSTDRSVEVGANLFVGNLDTMVDEKLLYDTFSTFGTVLRATVRKSEGGGAGGGVHQGTQFGFVAYDSFEASDLAVQCMNGQFLCNRQVRVQYALKKGSKTERHGSQAERLLAAEMQAKQNGKKGRPGAGPAASGPGAPGFAAAGPAAQQTFAPPHYQAPLPPMQQPPPMPRQHHQPPPPQQYPGAYQQQPQQYFGTPQYLMHPLPYAQRGLPPAMPAPPPLPPQFAAGGHARGERRPEPPRPPAAPARPPPPPPPPPPPAPK